MLLGLTAVQSLPWIQPAKALVQLAGAIAVRAIGPLVVQLVQPDPDAGNEFGGFPELQLEVVDLLGELLENRLGEAFALAVHADLDKQELALKTISPASLPRRKVDHLGQALFDLTGANQRLPFVPRPAHASGGPRHFPQGKSGRLISLPISPAGIRRFSIHPGSIRLFEAFLLQDGRNFLANFVQRVPAAAQVRPNAPELLFNGLLKRLNFPIGFL